MANTDPLSSQPISLVDWPHGPMHRLEKPGAYIVTSGTYQKKSFFQVPDHLTFLTNALLNLAETHGCMMQAWAVFPNHYHFVAAFPKSNALQQMIRHLHSATAIEINKHHSVPNRKVWFSIGNLISPSRGPISQELITFSKTQCATES